MTDKLDLSKPVQTRGGRKVHILCADINAVIGEPVYLPVIGIMPGTMEIGRWDKNGHASSGLDSKDDLINVPEKYVKYTNIIRNQDGTLSIGIGLFDSIVRADSCAHNERIARIRIEFEEGQFDE